MKKKDKVKDVKALNKGVNPETHAIVPLATIAELGELRVDWHYATLTRHEIFDEDIPDNKKIYNFLFLLFDKFTMAKRYAKLLGIQFGEEITERMDAYLEFERQLVLLFNERLGEHADFFKLGWHFELAEAEWIDAMRAGLPNGTELYWKLFCNDQRLHDKWLVGEEGVGNKNAD